MDSWEKRVSVPVGTETQLSYDGGHDRIGYIGRRMTRCLVCRERWNCLVADSSEGEYTEFAICSRCFSKVMQK